MAWESPLRIAILVATFAGFLPAWQLLYWPWAHAAVLYSRHLCWCVISSTIKPSGHLCHEQPTLSPTMCCPRPCASTKPTTAQPTDTIPLRIMLGQLASAMLHAAPTSAAPCL